MTPTSSQHQETIGQLYDRTTEMIEKIMGGSLHNGYWDDPMDGASLEAASERLTELMIDKLDASKGRRILDIGCGTGRPAIALARTAGVDVVGVTISEREVELGSRLAKDEGLADRVTFHVADALELPFEPDSFDGAWLFESLLHMPDQARVLRQAYSVLRPGGVLVIANLVERAPLADEQRGRLEASYHDSHIDSIIPLRDYPGFIADSGLALREIIDISEHTMSPTLHRIVERIAGLREEFPEYDGVIEPPPFVARLIETPEIGYAIIVAAKPERLAGS
ncbi:SAM-dependent methyltransferase [Nonomuraea sp. NPDC049028]|uniref:SAM-dependent methyltransferase n=1 Tax=Nonomuraea sp. NPDC049028 TaxID=3364348 RepID=UPI0037101DBD